MKTRRQKIKQAIELARQGPASLTQEHCDLLNRYAHGKREFTPRPLEPEGETLMLFFHSEAERAEFKKQWDQLPKLPDSSHLMLIFLKPPKE